MSYPDTPFQHTLATHHAPSEIRKWAGDRSLDQTWAECPRGEWMLALDRHGVVQIDREALDPALADYDETVDTAQAVYFGAVAQAGAVYNEAARKARKAYREAVTPAWADYHGDAVQAWATLTEAAASALAAYDAATAQASAALASAIRTVYPTPPLKEER